MNLHRVRRAQHGHSTKKLLCQTMGSGAKPSPSVRLAKVNRCGALHVKETGTAIGKLRHATDMDSSKVVRLDAQESFSEVTKPFSWTARWWPIQAIESMDPKIPMHVDLLGMSLVVWADTKGSWHCLEDKCPHRLAPLSEGRVEPQGLMCCYHGWTFDGNGSCTSIPQMAPDAEAAACSSKRACVKSYPTMVAHGLLWVWPEAGQTEAAQAAVKDLNELMHVEDYAPWVARDLPIRYDILLENVVDPSHADYSHHGLQGNRHTRVNARAWEGMTVSAVSKTGWEASSGTGSRSITFNAPSMLRYGASGAQSFIVPTKPGWSKLMYRMPVKMLMGPLPYFMASWMLGFDHAERNTVFDGDAVLLHIAERRLTPSRGLGINSVAKAYYMPAKLDSMVMAFRKWIQEHAGPIPTCTPEDEPLIPPLMLPEQVLDRYNQHVKNCVHCKNALNLTETAIMVTRVVGVLATFAAVSQAVVAGSVSHMQLSAGAGSVQTSAVASWFQALTETGMSVSLPVSMAVVVAALLADSWLNNSRRKFFSQEYIHALRD